MKQIQHIGIIGAGIAGLTAGIMLQKKGFKISIFEASPNIRGIGAGIGLASNGIKAFEYLGLAEAVKEISYPLESFEVSDEKGKKLFSIDTERISRNYNQGNFSIHRADLHAFLVNQLKGDPIQVSKKLKNLEQQSEKVILKFEDQTQVKVDFVIGADGINSTTRQLLIPDAQPQYAGYWCWRGIVSHNKVIFKNSRAFWGKMGRFGITPISENSVYWFACKNSSLTGEISQFDLEDLKENFKEYHPKVSTLLNLSKKDEIISTPIMDLKPLKNFLFSKVLLIGDAAHAATPNMGQGACMALEDVAVLQDELQQHDFLTACLNFEKRRLKRTEYIIKNSRRAGRIAQTQQSFLLFLRNNMFRLLPEKLTQLPVRALYDEDFMKVGT